MSSGKQYEQNKFNKRNFKKQTQQNTKAEKYNEFNKKCNSINIRMDQAKKESVS